MPGDWIYFKNKTRRWEGPVKITTKDGKLLYVVRAGRLMTINSDHAVLATTSGEVSTEKQDVRNVRQAEKGNEKRDNGEEEIEEIEEVSNVQNVQDDQNFQESPEVQENGGDLFQHDENGSCNELGGLGGGHSVDQLPLSTTQH